jgi:Asp-tRNA(Asn)/Glu-tRNA(Gln) amidotransferase A subunit family amidase
MPPIYELSAANLARQIRDRNISPVTAVEVVLERIHARNDRTNAFVTITDSLAREAAADAERAIENGERLGPLHGVPVAIKDLDNVAGVRTTFGSKLFTDHVAEEDDLFVTRLTDAGAIVVGKTNTPEFGLGCTTDNRVLGPTGTPFAPEKVSGGSSGGAGAALADHLVPLAQGSDTGGSIRTPAAFCGVYGIKPSFGRVPRSNRPNAFADHTPFSHYGPLARTVEDAALMLEVMAGPHPKDPFSLPDDGIPYLDAVDRSIEDLNVAYSPNLGIYPVDPAVREVIDEAVHAFEAAGASVERVDPDLGCTQEELLEVYYTFAKVLWEALFDGLETEHGLDPRGADRDELRPVTVETILESGDVTTREYKRADVTRTRVYDGLVDFFGEYDILLAPTTAVQPFDHGDHPTTVDETKIEPLRGWLLTQPFNLSGHPVASVPAGLTNDGLPVGMQIIGPRHADDDVLAASAAFERAKPWDDTYPAVSC